MPDPLLYVSHDDADHIALGELEKQLKAQQGYRWWHRGLVQPGLDPAPEAREALDQADVVLLLLSPDYLAHDALVREAERAMQSTARVVPLPIRASVWKTAAFGRLQPLLGEDKPLPDWPDKDLFWQQVTLQLLRLLAPAQQPPRPRPPGPPGPPGPDDRAGQRQSVTTRLSPDGAVTHYHRRAPVRGAAGKSPQGSQPTDLFPALFPAGTWDALSQHLHGRPIAPSRQPLLVRLWCDEPDLLALPWEELSHKDDALCAPGHGWIVTRCPRGEPSAVVELQSLGRLLAVVAPGDDGDAHVQALHEILAALSPHHVRAPHLRIVRDPAQAPAAIGEFDPLLLHVHGPATCLPAAAHQALSRVRLLSLCGAGWHPTALAVADLPMQVLTQAPTQRAAGTLSLQVLRALLQGCDDAAVAVHQLHLGPSVALYAGCERLAVSAPPIERLHPLAHLRVDRKAQRAQAYHQVSELLRSSTGRVEALIAYGAPGNLVDQFCWQALDHIETQGVALRKLPIALPRPGQRVRQTIYADLLQRLDAGPGADPAHALRRAADRAKVLWLDFGTFGEDLSPQDLSEWLEMCHRDLAPACPRQLRVVPYLALEVEAELHQGLRELVHDLRSRLFNERCRCELLPPLDVIDVIDLRDFLREPQNSSCAAALAQKAAELIHAASGGRYHQVAELIKEAERTSWYDLIERLSPKAPGKPAIPKGWRR